MRVGDGYDRRRGHDAEGQRTGTLDFVKRDRHVVSLKLKGCGVFVSQRYNRRAFSGSSDVDSTTVVPLVSLPKSGLWKANEVKNGKYIE